MILDSTPLILRTGAFPIDIPVCARVSHARQKWNLIQVRKNRNEMEEDTPGSPQDPSTITMESRECCTFQAVLWTLADDNFAGDFSGGIQFLSCGEQPCAVFPIRSGRREGIGYCSGRHEGTEKPLSTSFPPSPGSMVAAAPEHVPTAAAARPTQ